MHLFILTRFSVGVYSASRITYGIVLIIITSIAGSSAWGQALDSLKLDKVPPLDLPTWAPPVGNGAPNDVVSYDLGSKETKISQALPSVSDTILFLAGSRGVVHDNRKGQGDKGILNFSPLVPAQSVINTSAYPASAVVKLFISQDGYTMGSCSGVLIDKDLVLTAGHCVCNHSSPYPWPASILVVPGYNNGTSSFPVAYATYVYTTSGWYSNRDFNWDIGIIKLGAPIGNTVGWLGYGTQSDSYFLTPSFGSLGYPSEYPYTGNSMYYFGGSFDYVRGNTVGHYSFAYKGQSGSATFASYQNGTFAHAVLSNGDKTTIPPYTNHCRLTPANVNFIQTLSGNYRRLEVDDKTDLPGRSNAWYVHEDRSLHFPGDDDADCSVVIFDILGRRIVSIESEETVAATGYRQVSLAPYQLPKGQYFAAIISATSVHAEKFWVP